MKSVPTPGFAHALKRTLIPLGFLQFAPDSWPLRTGQMALRNGVSSREKEDRIRLRPPSRVQARPTSEVQCVLVMEIMTDALLNFARLDCIARCGLSLIPNRRFLGLELRKAMMLNESAQCDL